MSQPGTSKNHGYSLDVTDMRNFGGEALRIVEPENLRINPNAEGMKPAPNDGNDGQYQGKRGTRYTEYQTQELQAFLEKHPNPSCEQREGLSRAIGLTPLQVKFWCQNKQTTLRSQHKTQEITRLRSKIEELQAENAKYKEALRAAYLESCGGITSRERQLMLENARLKDEIGKILAIASLHVKRPSVSTYPHPPSSSHAPWPFQIQSSPIRPASMFPEGGNMYQPKQNYLTDGPAVAADQSNPGAPGYNPRDVCDLTLAIANPQDRTS